LTEKRRLFTLNHHHPLKPLPKQRVRLVPNCCGDRFLAATQKIRKDIFLYKVGLPTTTGLVQQPVQIVVRYRSHNLTLFVMPNCIKNSSFDISDDEIYFSVVLSINLDRKIKNSFFAFPLSCPPRLLTSVKIFGVVANFAKLPKSSSNILKSSAQNLSLVLLNVSINLGLTHPTR